MFFRIIFVVVVVVGSLVSFGSLARFPVALQVSCTPLLAHMGVCHFRVAHYSFTAATITLYTCDALCLALPRSLSLSVSCILSLSIYI